MAVIKKLYFTTGVDVTPPTDLTSESSTTRVDEYVDDTAFVTANGAASAGDLYINTTLKALRLFTGTAWRNVVMSANAADPTKTFLIDATAATTATSATLAFANTVSRTYTFQDETGTVPVLPIDLGTEVTNQLDIPNGGTGQSTAAGAINALVPAQAGNVGKYLRTNGTVVAWDDAAGGGGGGASLNVVENPNDVVLGWATTGAGITIATTLTSSELPLEGVISSAIKITPVSGTDYAHYRFTMPVSFKNSTLGLSFYQRALAGYTAGDLKVDLYTNTTSNYLGTYVRIPLASDISSVSEIPNASQQFATTFASNSLDYYEFRITRVSGTSPISITNVSLGDRNAADSTLDPTLMTDIQASRMGYKTYLDGVAYNGGNSPVATASSGTVIQGRYTPHQAQNGDWFLRFAVRVSSAVNGCFITISGVDLAFEEAVYCSTDGLAPDYASGFGFCVIATDRIYAQTAAGTGSVYLAGVVGLNAKPNWVY